MADELNNLYDKIHEERGALGKLLSKIPGFRGYMEKKGRRDADQLMRDTISGRLQQTRLELAGVSHTLSRDIVMGIEYAEAIGRADNQFMGLIAKIKDAPQGYAGFFDAVKVKEDDLERLYWFDEQMLTHAEQIQADVAALNKAAGEGANLDAAIVMLNQDLQNANQAFNRRQEVLNQVTVTTDAAGMGAAATEATDAGDESITITKESLG